MTFAVEEKETAKNRRHQNSAPKLSPLEAEVISLFVQVSGVLRQPRSMGEIYGLLFISPRPLALDHFIDQLGMSKGSASIGLKSLRKAGAIKMVYVPRDRRVHYEAVAELRNLASRFLSDQVAPQLDSAGYRLGNIVNMMKQLPAEERGHVSARVATLTTWEKKSRRFLPMLLKILRG